MAAGAAQQQQQRKRRAEAEEAWARAGLGAVLRAIGEATTALEKLRRYARRNVIAVEKGGGDGTIASALARASAAADAAASRALSLALDSSFSRLARLLEAATPPGTYSGEDPPDPGARPRVEPLALGVAALLGVFRGASVPAAAAEGGGAGEKKTEQQPPFPVPLAGPNSDALSLDIARRTAKLLRSGVLKRHAFSAAGGAMAWKSDLDCVAAALSSSSSSSSSSSAPTSSSSSPKLAEAALSGLDAAASLLMVPAEALAALLGPGVGAALGRGGAGGASAAAAAAAAASAAAAAAQAAADSSSSSSKNNSNALGAPWRDVADTLQARADVRGAGGGGGGGGGVAV
jgi:hypothetical protein